MVKLLFHADERSGIRVLTLPGRFFVFKKDIMKVMYRFSFSFFSLLFFCFFFCHLFKSSKSRYVQLKKTVEPCQYKNKAYRNIALRFSISYSRVGLQEPLIMIKMSFVPNSSRRKKSFKKCPNERNLVNCARLTRKKTYQICLAKYKKNLVFIPLATSC